MAVQSLLYNKLGDDFDDHDGGFHEYVRIVGSDYVNVPINKHYNLRSFHATNLTVPWTALDYQFWQNFRYAGVIIGDPRSIVNATLRRRTQDELSISTDTGGTDTTYYTMGQMNDMTIQQIERLQTATGNEEWTIGGSIFLGREPTYRQANVYTVPLTGGTLSTLSSFYNDDILTDFQDQSHYIELVLRDFPAQVAGAHLDLANSYIDFTSAADFPAPLTVSGNEITDAVRTTNTQGDGRANLESSFGIWKGTTNLVINGGAETNTTGYVAAVGTETVSRVTTQKKFGTASVQTVTLATNNSGVYATTNSLTSGTTYTSSVWVKAPSAQPMNIYMSRTGGITVGSVVPFVGNGDWQRVSVTFTPGTTEAHFINIRITTATALTFWVDGVQTEASAFATPYVHTNGSTAARAAAKVTAPSSFIDATEGYASFRVRIGTDNVVEQSTLLGYTDGVSYMAMGHSPSKGGVYIQTSTTTDLTIPGILTPGTIHTLTFIWRSDILGISIDGAPLVTKPRVAGALPAATTFEIGAYASPTQLFNGDILWAAIGKGQLDNTQAAQINAFGDVDHYASDFPESGETTMVWFANTSFINDADSDYVRFDESLNLLTAGGDTYWRIDRNRLVNADLTDLKAIRFRLLSTGSMTFKAQAMRLIPADHTFYPLEIDTKRAFLSRTVPRTGTPEIAGVMGDLYFKQSRAENTTNYTKFHSGTNPVGNDNVLKLFYRQRNLGADRLEVQVLARSTQCRIRMYSRVAGVDTEIFSTNTNTNTLTAGTDYYLVTEVKGNQIRATMYLTYGITLGASQFTTGWQTIPASNAYTRGLNGFAFEPYNYDFTIDYINAQESEFGHFESKSYTSYTPVEGASLFASTSPAANMLGDTTFQQWGDATISDVSDYTNVVREGTMYQGGMRNTRPVFVGNANQVTIRGEIYPVGQVQGTYRIALVDRNDTVGYISNLSNLLPDQWNEFEIPIIAPILPTSFYFHIQQQGYHADTFRLRNISIDHNTIGWEGSNDGGTTWQPFLDTINERWGAVKFAVDTGKALRVRATAHGDIAWIGGYELVPRYKK